MFCWDIKEKQFQTSDDSLVISQEQQQPLLIFCLRQKVFWRNSFPFTCYLWLQNRSSNWGKFGSYLILAKLKLRDVNILLLASLYKHQFLNKMFKKTFFEEHTGYWSPCHFKWLKLLKILYSILLTLSKYMNNCLYLKYF